MRLDEINARLAAIQQEAETASSDALTALENEAAALTAERQQQEDAAFCTSIYAASCSVDGQSRCCTEFQ